MSSSTAKYTLSEHTSGIGIDLTSGAVRLLHLSITNGAFRICAAAAVNAEQEGILDGQELAETMGKWLADRNLTTVPACASLPPMATTESIFDLPPALPSAEIGKMVAVQARALANISDEQFIHDFQLIRVPKDTRQPVIMEIIREATVNQQYRLFSEHHACIRQMTSHGLAAVNALLTLHPTASVTAGLQLLLNVESDYCALSILRGGHLVGQSWLSYSAHEGDHSLQLLKDEISAALERWHESNKSTDAPAIPHTLWLTGEGATRKGFRDMLGQAYPWQEIRILGVPDTFLEATDIAATDSSQDGLHPELIVAFGLALQSIGTSPITISLIPELARWQQERMKNFPLLVVSVACVFFGLLSMYLGLSFRMKSEEAKLIAEENAIRRCQELVPKLDKARKQLDFHQKQMLPIVEVGQRTCRFLEALKTWDKALEGENGSQHQNWGIFLADEHSFNIVNRERTTTKNDRQKNVNEPEFDMTTRIMPEISPFDTASQPALQPFQASSGTQFKQKLTPVTDIHFLKNIYIGGITPLGESRYKVIKEIQTRLMESNIYTNVDDHIDFLVKAFNDRYFLPWMDFLRDNKQALGNDYTVFFLQLPFKYNYIDEEALNSNLNDLKKKNKKN